MNAQMIWDDLHVFLSTARAGGLTGASRSLGVHHATVGRRIERLEADLGVRLFERHPRGYTLTAAGEDLVAHVQSMEGTVHAIRRDIAGRDQALAGIVRLSTVDDLASFVLPELLAAFADRHPAVQVEVDVRTEVADLARREADVALRFGQPPQDAGGVRRRVTFVDSGLYASRTYLERFGHPASLTDLDRHRIVRAGEALSALPIEPVWEAHTRPEQAAVRSDSMLVQYASIRAGVGIGWASKFMIQPDHDLERLDLDGLPDLRVAMWMVMHEDIRDAARIRTFADFTYEWFADRRARFVWG